MCIAANGTSIEFLGALSLPVLQNREQIWIEVQIPKDRLPKPVDNIDRDY